LVPVPDTIPVDFINLKLRTLPHDSHKVLIGDNLATHLSPYVLAMCERFKVKFIFLPENSTHLLQPLDVSVFRPLKMNWRKVVRKFREAVLRSQ